jgi:GntR family transcriptional regulator
MDENNPEQRKYMRLAALLRDEITNGLRAPGSPLPSIKDLCRAHGVSRQTAGKALRILHADEVIYRMPGLGYFVAACGAA